MFFGYTAATCSQPFISKKNNNELGLSSMTKCDSSREV